MKKLLWGMVLSVLSFSSLSSKIHADKTFLATRPQLDNLAVQYASWHEQIGDCYGKSFGGTLQGTVFYQQSTNTSELGKYFGSHATYGGDAYRDYIKVTNQETNPVLNGNLDDVWAEYIVHDTAGAPGNNLSGKLQFNPKQEQFIARLDFHHRLDKIVDGLFFEISTPVAYVKNNMHLRKIGDVTPIKIAGSPSSESGKTLLDYFHGNVFDLGLDSASQQQPLTHAKMGGMISKTRVADILAKLGYKVINEKWRWLGFGLTCKIPTGNRPSGEYVFEPICGNGNHWELGGSIDGKARLCEKDTASLDLVCALNVKYVFESTEKRTLGLKTNAGKPIPFSQYYLAGRQGSRALFPLANVSTKDLLVAPGGQFEGLANFALNLNWVSVNLGYNILVRQAESVELKHAWASGEYGIAQYSKHTSGNTVSFLYEVGQTPPAVDQIDDALFSRCPITNNNLNLDIATTPLQVMHKIYLTIGHTIQKEHPLMVAVGGAYEFAQDNEAINDYSLWGSMSIAF